MRGKFNSALCGVLCVATAVFGAPVEALAGPASLADQASLRQPAPVDYVHYRRYHRRYYRYGYDPSGAIFAGAAMGLMAAGVAAASQPRYYYGYPGYYGYPVYGGWGW
ncbi:hypothetical protein [Methylocystis bryophila]|uniref:Transmembrane protein n=1 Tax=Methylocystis bryophila TaxID=655015 RepID=A0A1W6MSM0_9HYPH|nr:hypothetical protein [Methylocystis bryophila]ARN80489.1 hypothetical protein B1812_04710 [Methylocystis bryophila]BDV40513.1 hypothetical protein DSM21852_37660 [Methylocystis bryophila]